MDYAFNADPTSKRFSNPTQNANKISPKPKPKPQSKTKSKSTPKSIVPKKTKQTPVVKKTKNTPIKKSTKTPKITLPPKSNAKKISLPKSTNEKSLPKRTKKPFPLKKHLTRRSFLDDVNTSKDNLPPTKKSDALKKLNEFLGELDSDD